MSKILFFREYSTILQTWDKNVKLECSIVDKLWVWLTCQNCCISGYNPPNKPHPTDTITYELPVDKIIDARAFHGRIESIPSSGVDCVACTFSFPCAYAIGEIFFSWSNRMHSPSVRQRQRQARSHVPSRRHHRGSFDGGQLERSWTKSN